MSTSVALVVWFCCDIIDNLELRHSIKFILENYGDTTRPGLRPPMAKRLEKYSKNNKLEINVLSSLILTLTAVDKLFNIVLYLVGILFIISVTGHHHLSLIPCLQSPAVLTQPRQFTPTPGRHYPSPAVRISRQYHVCLTILRMG